VKASRKNQTPSVEYPESAKPERRHGLVGPHTLWQEKREFQSQFLREMGLEPQHYLLDIGCGTLRGGIPLIQYLHTGHYYGFDVWGKLIKEARKEVNVTGLEEKAPRLFALPTISHLEVDVSFDFIWAFSVLIHISDAVLDETLYFASRHLSESGVFYANVNTAKRKKDGTWRGFPLVARPLDFYNQACDANDLVMHDMGSLKELGHETNRKTDDNHRMLKMIRKG